jgi:hypothetical protein
MKQESMSAPLRTPSMASKIEDERYENKDAASSGIMSPPPHRPVKNGDAALAILGDGTIRHEITEEQDAAVLRKIDRWILPVILMVYFLQQLDKCVHYRPEVGDHKPNFQVLSVVHLGLRNSGRDRSASQ